MSKKRGQVEQTDVQEKETMNLAENAAAEEVSGGVEDVEKAPEENKEVGVISDLRGELEFSIKMCNNMLRHSDFDGIDASGTDDRSIAYSRINSAITRLKIARDKLS